MSVIIDLVEHHIQNSSANHPARGECCGDGTSLGKNIRGSSQTTLVETGSLKHGSCKTRQTACEQANRAHRARLTGVLENCVCELNARAQACNICHSHDQPASVCSFCVVHVTAHEGLCVDLSAMRETIKGFFFSSLCLYNSTQSKNTSVFLSLLCGGSSPHQNSVFLH